MAELEPKYKVAFLDWYGTLSISKFWGHLDTDIINKIDASLFGKLKPMIDPWMRGEYASEDVVNELALDTGLPEQMLLNELIRSCKSMQFVEKDTNDLVRKLRNRGTKVVIATDNMDSFTRWTAPAMRLHDIFDGILNSYELKAVKRDFDSSGHSLFFAKFLEENGVAHGESIIIDDGEDKEGKIQRNGIVYKKIKHGEGISKELLELM